MLDTAIQRFQGRDADLFQCIVEAIANKDTARSHIFAGELGEIRKVEKMLIQESLALESVSMRLKTVSEVGDLVIILAPAASVLSNVRSGMSGILPQASQELQRIGGLLGDIMTSRSQSSDMSVSIGLSTNADALAILEETEVAAEKRVRDQFPDVATGIAASKRTSIEAQHDRSKGAMTGTSFFFLFSLFCLIFLKRKNKQGLDVFLFFLDCRYSGYDYLNLAYDWMD